MKITFVKSVPKDADLLIRFIQEDEQPGDLPEKAVADSKKQSVLLYDGDRRIGVVTIRKGDDRGEFLRKAGASAADLSHGIKAAHVALQLPKSGVEDLVEGFILGGYRFNTYLTSDDVFDIKRVSLIGKETEELSRTIIRANAASYARDLVNRSPNEKTAELLAEEAAAMAKKAGLRCEVWTQSRIEKERMGGLLAVNKGSITPPRFVILEHAPRGTKKDAPIVLVGKAVVFDTGGLSLKPTAGSMDSMKCDMAGGAAVIGTMRALAELKLKRRVVALIPMTDNRPGVEAYVPGDVIRMRSGLTVEVLNTDAEGRMILADALDVAKEYKPEVVLDVATLTGAAVVALGDRVAAGYGTDDAPLNELIVSGDETGEWVHPMPLREHYGEQIKSKVGDLKNIGGRDAGSVTAAKFLQRFTQNAKGEALYPWLHVDIAGPAFTDKPQPYRPVGGTGFGVRLLVNWIEKISG